MTGARGLLAQRVGGALLVLPGFFEFGCLARVAGLMTDFIAAAKAQEALGIPINDWILFLRRHSDNSDPVQVTLRSRWN